MSEWGIPAFAMIRVDILSTGNVVVNDGKVNRLSHLCFNQSTNIKSYSSFRRVVLVP